MIYDTLVSYPSAVKLQSMNIKPKKIQEGQCFYLNPDKGFTATTHRHTLAVVDLVREHLSSTKFLKREGVRDHTEWRLIQELWAPSALDLLLLYPDIQINSEVGVEDDDIQGPYFKIKSGLHSVSHRRAADGIVDLLAIMDDCI